MVLRNLPEGSKRRALLDNMTIILEPVTLPEAEEAARIKRLSKLILDCIERARRDRERKKVRRDDDDLLAKDLDEILGLMESPA